MNNKHKPGKKVMQALGLGQGRKKCMQGRVGTRTPGAGK